MALRRSSSVLFHKRSIVVRTSEMLWIRDESLVIDVQSLQLFQERKTNLSQLIAESVALISERLELLDKLEIMSISFRDEDDFEEWRR